MFFHIIYVNRQHHHSTVLRVISCCQKRTHKSVKCYTTAISTGHMSTEMFIFIGNTIPLNRFMQGENPLCNIQYATVRMSLTFELIQVNSLFKKKKKIKCNSIEFQQSLRASQIFHN